MRIEGQGSGGDADGDAETGDDENITGRGFSDERSPQTNESGKIDLNDLPQMAGGVFDMTNEDGSQFSEDELQEQITKLDAQVMMAEKVQGMINSGEGSGLITLEVVSLNWLSKLFLGRICLEICSLGFNRTITLGLCLIADTWLEVSICLVGQRTINQKCCDAG